MRDQILPLEALTGGDSEFTCIDGDLQDLAATFAPQERPTGAIVYFIADSISEVWFTTDENPDARQAEYKRVY